MPEVSQYDGVDVSKLVAQARSTVAIRAFDSVSSTMDIGHDLAAQNKPAGTVIVAESQSSGRGRSGKSWTSSMGTGVWLTLLERPANAQVLDVLSLRVGLYLARVLDGYAERSVQLKWPNDLYIGGRKLGGILIETRWREDRIDYVLIGVGINLVPSEDQPLSVGLKRGVRASQLLVDIIPQLRLAAQIAGPFSDEELMEFSSRDFAVGRSCSSPMRGVVEGINQDGELLVRSGSETVAVRSGSLLLD